MHRLIVLLVSAFLAFGAPARAQPTPEERAAVASALQRGALIHAYDQAAWHGTDDMLTKLPDPRGKIAGWIVDGPVDAPELVFYDRSEDPHAVYVARFDKGKLVSGRVLGAGDDRTLSPARRKLIAAAAAASEAIRAGGYRGCVDKPFNSVVLPPAAPDGPILVYYLTPQTTRDSIPLGGHYRVEVGADGVAGPVRRFTKSCMALPLAPPKDGKPVAAMVNHLLDSTPTEIHVFSAMAMRRPLVVMAGGKTWIVTGSGIALLGGRKRD